MDNADKLAKKLANAFRAGAVPFTAGISGAALAFYMGSIHNTNSVLYGLIGSFLLSGGSLVGIAKFAEGLEKPVEQKKASSQKLDHP